MSRELIDFGFSNSLRDEVETSIKSNSNSIRTIEENVNSLKLQMDSYADEFVPIEKFTELEFKFQAYQEEIETKLNSLHDEVINIRDEVNRKIEELESSYQARSVQTDENIKMMRTDLNDFHSLQIKKYAELDQRLLGLSDALAVHINPHSDKPLNKSKKNVISSASIQAGTNPSKANHDESSLIELTLEPNEAFPNHENKEKKVFVDEPTPNPNKIQIKKSWLKSFMKLIAGKFSKQNKIIDEIKLGAKSQPEQMSELP